MSTIALYHAYNPEMSSALVSFRQAVEALEVGLLSVKLYSEMVDDQICNFDDLRTNIQASTEILDEKEQSLDNYS